MRIVAVLITLCLLSGCPLPQFPDCPAPPTLDYTASDPALVGAWEGNVGYYSGSGFQYIYAVGLALNADRSFLLNIYDDFGSHTIEGVWSVDALAQPYPRIQFAVACSDSDRYPASEWLRGAYWLQFEDLYGEVYLQIAVANYPDSAIINPDWIDIAWRLWKQ